MLLCRGLPCLSADRARAGQTRKGRVGWGDPLLLLQVLVSGTSLSPGFSPCLQSVLPQHEYSFTGEKSIEGFFPQVSRVGSKMLKKDHTNSNSR